MTFIFGILLVGVLKQVGYIDWRCPSVCPSVNIKVNVSWLNVDSLNAPQITFGKGCIIGMYRTLLTGKQFQCSHRAVSASFLWKSHGARVASLQRMYGSFGNISNEINHIILQMKIKCFFL